jgi:hypothetical protein
LLKEDDEGEQEERIKSMFVVLIYGCDHLYCCLDRGIENIYELDYAYLNCQ